MTLDKGKLNHIYTIHRINNDGEIRTFTVVTEKLNPNKCYFLKIIDYKS